MTGLSPAGFQVVMGEQQRQLQHLQVCTGGEMYKEDLSRLMEGIPVRLGFVPGRSRPGCSLRSFSERGGGEALFLLESEPGAVVIGPQR